MGVNESPESKSFLTQLIPVDVILLDGELLSFEMRVKSSGSFCLRSIHCNYLKRHSKKAVTGDFPRPV